MYKKKKNQFIKKWNIADSDRKNKINVYKKKKFYKKNEFI